MLLSPAARQDAVAVLNLRGSEAQFLEKSWKPDAPILEVS
jgi:hypothetical protein